MTLRITPVANDQINPFELAVPQAELDDLNTRLDAVRWPNEVPGQGWSLGAPVEYLKDLTNHWRHEYNWREQEAKINEHPQFTTTIDGANIHFFHIRSEEPDALPLIINHGWPSSPVEYLDLIEPLTNPGAHGGGQAFHLVIPSLPGYGLSGETTETGWGSARIAKALVELMRRLGYDRYGAHGSDWGTWISREMGSIAPQAVTAVHGAGFITWPDGTPGEFDGLSQEDGERLGFGEYYMAQLYGYKMIQSTRPQALAYGLSDSPAGLAGWMASVFKEWTDCVDSPDESVGRDRLLTTIMLYWLTNTAASAARSFVETPDTAEHADLAADVATTAVPTGVAVFPKGILRPVRRFAERDNNIVSWSEFGAGGTFAAMEQPDALRGDLAKFFAEHR